jgi:hypothetical protein
VKSTLAAATILTLTAAPALLAGTAITVSDTGGSLLIGVGLVAFACLLRRRTRTE